MNTEENNQEQKYLDIYPISKGKRILTFLADFFITLITSIFLFNIIIYPIGKTIAKIDEKTNEIYTLEKEKYDLLYDSKILFYDSDYKYSYINNLETSMKKFIYYYTGDNTDLENEFIRHFYIDLRNKDLNFLLNFYKNNNKSGIEFFDYDNLDSNGLPTLIDQYKEDFSDYLKYPEDNKGTSSEANYNKFYQNFFTNIYGNLLKDIIENDFEFPGHELSYNEIEKNIATLERSNTSLITICSFISYFITIICFYVLIPFLTSRGKTPATYFMRIERTKKYNLNLCGIFEKISSLIFYIISFMPSLLFISFPTIAFADLFSNTVLLVLSGITAIYLIISFIVLLFNKYNQTLSDLSSQTILIATEDLDSIYRLKGTNNG